MAMTTVPIFLGTVAMTTLTAGALYLSLHLIIVSYQPLLIVNIVFFAVCGGAPSCWRVRLY